ncbi:ABC transporter substrate-binding protein [Myroides sp. NP-2]|uniref:ABC transporter substrate-binding protein n=1 Tax=Myroides sp. NP-2 TaxID=2759945 RepID=UPI0015FBD0EE|nr:ABC transporter substrate-binding protein [Myroides sp. NP-2]MBB1148889.1 ABC transporter substrate-binding protein [Myroides sp. NP-2]
MKKLVFYLMGCTLFVFCSSCKQQLKEEEIQQTEQSNIDYAKGFNFTSYDDVYVVNITQPWANANTRFTYVLKRATAQVPDSLQKYPQIQIPIQSLVATSTTHIPALDVLNQVPSLVGFAGLDYVSTPAVRQQIDLGKVREVGQNDALNVEVILDVQPDVLMAFAMNKEDKSLQTLANAGIPILYNGDWTEQNPLGKAEWIKLFGLLYDKEKEASAFFDQIVIDYTAALQLVKAVTKQPTVMSGVMYADVWYLPEGKSWAAVYFSDAQTDYLWKDTQGVGSLALSFEQVLEKAQHATYWINPGHYESLAELAQANPHYKEFEAFKNKNVYSFAPTKGPTGGSLFYEIGGMRPDWVLKDLIHLVHPEVLPEYEPHFYKQLK